MVVMKTAKNRGGWDTDEMSTFAEIRSERNQVDCRRSATKVMRRMRRPNIGTKRCKRRNDQVPRNQTKMEPGRNRRWSSDLTKYAPGRPEKGRWLTKQKVVPRLSSQWSRVAMMTSVGSTSWSSARHRDTRPRFHDKGHSLLTYL